MSSPFPLAADPPRTVVVIGGGISGLAAAYELVQQGIACTLIDPSSQLGGVIRTEHSDGCLVEAGPDSFLAQKPAALELIKELGLEDQVIGSNDDRRRTFILRNGRLVQIPDGIQFMAPTKVWPVVKTPMLSVGAKLRMATELLRRPGVPKPDRSVAEFVIDHYGNEANEYLAQPMLAGVYGAEPENLSVSAVLPRFVELETETGSVSRALVAAMKKAPKRGPGQSLFRTLRGGMQTLTDALVTAIAGKAKTLQGRVTAVSHGEKRWTVQLEDGAVEADAVVLAVPAYEAGRLLESVDAGIVEPLQSIPYGSSITAGLVYERPGFDHPLEGFGFLVPRAEKRMIAACTWVGTKFADRVPGDRALLRSFLSGAQAQSRMDNSTESIAAEIDAELKSLMGFSAMPMSSRVTVWNRAMAQYPVGHAAIVPQIRSRAEAVPGLHLIGNAYEGIGIPDCIRLARRTARLVAGNVDN